MLFKITPILLLIMAICTVQVSAQCTTLGQTPQTAFPVCGSNVFEQSSVPECFNNVIIVNGCDNTGLGYADLNPYWYKFTCFKSGTLVFTITPNVITDDYDWQIFDVTGRDPSIVFSQDPGTIRQIFVACNWSGAAGAPTNGITGTSTKAANLTECASTRNSDPPILSRAPLLTQGHEYLLMVSHFSGDNQSGYKLSFTGGGTASITDTTAPAMLRAKPNCSGNKIGVKLNKKMKCSSLAADGSDFSISPAAAPISSVSAPACAAGFDMDSIVLTFSQPLPYGNYNIVAQKGSDGNSLQDICLNEVPEKSTTPFKVVAPLPVTLDSIIPATCAADMLTLVFARPVYCSSIAPDGSDFSITGPDGVTITQAYGDCEGNDGFTTRVYLKLSAPLVHAGSYQVKLTNTVIDECDLEIQPGLPLIVTTKDTVSANFSSKLMLGCKADSIVFAHDGANNVNSWLWVFNDGSTQTVPSFTKKYINNFGEKTVTLHVSNGFCSAQLSRTFLLDNQLKARFTLPAELCPQDMAVFVDSSLGHITAWTWDFGNGSTGNDRVPLPQRYPLVDRDKAFTVRLIVQNSLPCYDTAYKNITVLYNCYIDVPTAFTPNGDGLNDYLYPLNAYKARNLEFKVYNRWGQEVFATKDWTRKWDGTTKGNAQAPGGVYAWYLTYTNVDTGKKYFLKGTTVLIR